MIPLQEYKDALGDVAKELTEEQIVKLWHQQDQMAEIFFNMWLDDIKKKNKGQIEP
jgi:hypothetical protein